MKTNKEKQIVAINKVLAKYFSKQKDKIIPAKDMMPEFIKAGVFEKDNRNGLPIREILRNLDANNQLDLIPYVLPKRKKKYTSWYFRNQSVVSFDAVMPKKKTKDITPSQPSKRMNSDEWYVVSLCDEMLGEKANHQQRFDFLVGDTGRRLPVDAYYPKHNLVIEYKERQHTESVKFWNKRTASGISRDEQRMRYDQRRRDVLPNHGITLIEISYHDLCHNSRKRLLRRVEEDRKVISDILKSHGVI